ncbi:uncharacterized protein LOC121346028, partial [Onychostruthus taczanowskii]|uniref:uncharacterized protein LOC121346028 n=1 Tax=Onychostruthus taczanowskii TaxID=356909 RepID=UPI001B806107
LTEILIFFRDFQQKSPIFLNFNPNPRSSVRHSIIQTEFYQKSLDSKADSEQYMFDFDGDEIFHVEKEETVWRLPEFQEFASFEAQGALQNIAIDKQNLENSMKAYNNSRIPSEPPEVAVFPKHPVEQDEPNILICYVTKFWPPALGLSWLRNGVPVTRGVLETPIPPGPARSRGIPTQFQALGFLHPNPSWVSTQSQLVPLQSQLDLSQTQLGPTQSQLDPTQLFRLWIPHNFSWIHSNLMRFQPNPNWTDPIFAEPTLTPNSGIFPRISPRIFPEPPEVAVFPKHPVEQDEPNILICYVTKFWPPALGLSWLRNGVP